MATAIRMQSSGQVYKSKSVPTAGGMSQSLNLALLQPIFKHYPHQSCSSPKFIPVASPDISPSRSKNGVVGSEIRGCGWIVGNPSLTGLWKGCPSPAHNRRRCPQPPNLARSNSTNYRVSVIQSSNQYSRERPKSGGCHVQR